MASFYRATVQEFLVQSSEHILAALGVAYANRGYTSQYSDQTLTWERDLLLLRSVLERCVQASDHAASWGLLLEFSIPRKELRIDAVLLVRDIVVILEAKTGLALTPAKRQIEEYALLLHYFHKASSDCRIIPVVLSSTSPESRISEAERRALHQREFFAQLPTFWISEVIQSSWVALSDVLLVLEKQASGQASPQSWDEPILSCSQHYRSSNRAEDRLVDPRDSSFGGLRARNR